MSSLPVCALAKDLRAAIGRGHPWVYDRALAPGQPRALPGELVRVTWRGKHVALGYADPGRPIAVRIVARPGDEGAEGLALAPGWAFGRAFSAGRARAGHPLLAHTNAVRLVHGENDGMPGLVMDLYDDTAVVACDGLAASLFWAPRMDAVLAGLAEAGFSPARVWARPSGKTGRDGLSGVVRGSEPSPVVVIHEHGARFEVDVFRGQKTGLFLDQRDNRRLTGELCAGASVLNVFSYTGGFSVHAALGGARRVISVDSAEPAMAAARRNMARSGLAAGKHEFVVADAFAYLQRACDQGQRHDVVILDPPSFAPSEKAKAAGLRAYQRINHLGLALVAPGGLLMTASCSSHVSTDDLLGVVADAAFAVGRSTRVLYIRGAAGDHPVRPGFPEGHYLSFVGVYVDS